MIRRICIFTGAVLFLLGGFVMVCQFYSYAQLSKGFSPALPPAGLSLTPELQAFQFAAYGDFRSWVEALEQITQTISESQAAFIFCLGDMVHRHTTLDFHHVLQEMREHLSLPLYAVPGNHDKSDSNGWGLYRSFFGQDYYFFGYGDTLFIALNTADSDLPAAQQSFLRETLAREWIKYARCVIVCHVPPVDPRPEGSQCMEEEAVEIFREIIEPYRIDLIISGHLHQYADLEFAGTRLVIVPSAGQEIRDPENKMFGCVLFSFEQNGNITVTQYDVAAYTSMEELEYFLSVEICRIGWVIGGLTAVIVGLLTLFCGMLGNTKFARIVSRGVLPPQTSRKQPARSVRNVAVVRFRNFNCR